MKFTRLLPSIVALVAAMTLSFAAGAAPAQADPPTNPFAGSWSGTFSVQYQYDGEFEAVGTCDWTISAAGRMTGTFHNTKSGNSGPIVGHVSADGNLNLIVAVPGALYSGTPHKGTAIIDDGNLVASYTVTYSGGHSVVAILERN